MPLSSAERSFNARQAARARWERVVDRRAELGPARMGFLRRFMWEVDPQGCISYDDRVRLAKQRRAEYMRALRARRD